MKGQKAQLSIDKYRRNVGCQLRRLIGLRKEFDVDEMMRLIDVRVDDLERNMAPEDRKKIFSLLSDEDTVELCKICRLGTMKSMLLWILGEKEIEP